MFNMYYINSYSLLSGNVHKIKFDEPRDGLNTEIPNGNSKKSTLLPQWNLLFRKFY